MHYGTVVNGSEPTIDLTMISINGESVEVEFAVDTGFTDDVTLPFDIIEQLNLPINRDVQLVMADGAVYVGQAYTGWVLWHERVRRIDVISVDSTPLIGMRLLSGSNLSVDAEPDGLVTITELAAR
ncbi:MAG: hypothetical protein OXI54_01365 [Chloroflexota bacterium]|nr:hypothetical protein [Chloroflexota bacterium]MDE2682784.1 hypothetical protein [Chloroflexota bacterium]